MKRKTLNDFNDPRNFHEMLTGFRKMKIVHKNRCSQNGIHLKIVKMKTRNVLLSEMRIIQ